MRALPANPIEKDLDLVPVGEIPPVTLGGLQGVSWFCRDFGQPERVGTGHPYLRE